MVVDTNTTIQSEIFLLKVLVFGIIAMPGLLSQAENYDFNSQNPGICWLATDAVMLLWHIICIEKQCFIRISKTMHPQSHGIN